MCHMAISFPFIEKIIQIFYLVSRLYAFSIVLVATQTDFWSRKNAINIWDFSKTCDKLWTHIPSPLRYSWNLILVQEAHALPSRFHLCLFPLTVCKLCPCAKIFCDLSPFWLNHSANISLEKILSQICMGFLLVREVVLRGCQCLLLFFCSIQIFQLNTVNVHICHQMPGIPC